MISVGEKFKEPGLHCVGEFCKLVIDTMGEELNRIINQPKKFNITCDELELIF